MTSKWAEKWTRADERQPTARDLRRKKGGRKSRKVARHKRSAK
jgi:hypothetical protein